jgi:hypothetical protein
MDDKAISIRSGGLAGAGDRRCRRPSCVFPAPTIRFDFDRGRMVAVWSWVDVRVADVPLGVRIKMLPALRLVFISCN